MAPTGWWRALPCACGKPARWTIPQAMRRGAAAKVDAAAKDAEARAARRASVEAGASEPVPPLYPQAGRDVPDDGRRSAGRRHGVPPIAGLGPAPGGLSDYPGPDVLPRRQSGGGDLVDHRPAGEAVRASARIV